ncbi:STAS domain-containing protein [Kitasatospora sp. MBT63]|uniref:STAS domain-containing protein n=1 Tax=Kitasatospora sp. MBT63 TaxID=1444768 RepID=UPI00068D5767|nr:STAS domain-containing protein [Kitasatospora sp. MBT63]
MSADPNAARPTDGAPVPGGPDRRPAPPAAGSVDTVTCEITPGPDRTSAVVRGVMQLDTADRLEEALDTALRSTGTGMDVDLSAVTFCDSTGLNVLLRLRLAAAAEGRSLAVTSASPQVRRLFEITGTTSLFSPDPGSPTPNGTGAP